MAEFNLGNVVGILRKLTEPAKKYIIWAKKIDVGDADKVVLMYFDKIYNAWNHLNPGLSFYLAPVISANQTTPPVSPTLGDRYLLGAAPSGVWTGKAYNHATWMGNAWEFITPRDGAMARDLTSKSIIYYYDTTDWSSIDTVLDLGPGTTGQMFQYQSGAWTKTVQLKDASNVNALNISTRVLTNNAGTQVLNWNTHSTYDSNPILSMDWSGRHLFSDTSGATKALDWQTRQLFTDDGVNYTVDWANCFLRNLGITIIDWGANKKMFDQSGILSIDWSARTNIDSGSDISINWESRQLKGAGTELIRIDWQQAICYDVNEINSIHWSTRTLRDTANENSLDWGNRIARDVLGVRSVDWDTRILFWPNDVQAVNWAAGGLFNSSGTVKVNWDTGVLKDNSDEISLDWQNRISKDSASEYSINYETRVLHNTAGIGVLFWGEYYLKFGGVVIVDWSAGRYNDGNGDPMFRANSAYNTSGDITADFEGRALSSSTEVSLGWESYLLRSSGQFSINWSTRTTYDSTGLISLIYEGRQLYDASEVQAGNWALRYLYYADGSTVSIAWGSSVFNDSSGLNALNWSNRTLNNSAGGPLIDWSSPTDGAVYTSALTFGSNPRSIPDVGYVQYLAGTPLFQTFADGGNVTTGETDLYSYTTSAGLLAANGQRIEAEFGGVFVSSATATRQIKLYFGGTAIFDTGALTLSLSSAWTMYVTVIRKSSTIVRFMVSFATEGAALSAYTDVNELGSLTLSSTNILKVTGQAAGVGAATNDIVLKIGDGKWLNNV